MTIGAKRSSISDPVRDRSVAAASVAVRIVVVLGGAALIGREALGVLGIELNAFTIASVGDLHGVVVALVGVGAVAVAAFVSYAWLGDAISKTKPSTVTLLARIGGLLLATIGTQMLLGGVKEFFT